MHIDTRGALIVVLDGFKVIGKYHTLQQAEAAAEAYLA